MALVELHVRGMIMEKVATIDFHLFHHSILTDLFLYKTLTIILFRAKCPNSCSGNGVCLSLADSGVLYGTDYDHSVANGGDGIGPAYNNWDAESISICFCDWGSYGPDCSLSKLV